MKRGGEADDYWQRNPGPRYDGFGKSKGYDGGGSGYAGYAGYDSGSRGYDGGGGGKGYDGGGKGYMGYAAAGGGKGYDGAGKGYDGGGKGKGKGKTPDWGKGGGGKGHDLGKGKGYHDERSGRAQAQPPMAAPPAQRSPPVQRGTPGESGRRGGGEAAGGPGEGADPIVELESLPPEIVIEIDHAPARSAAPVAAALERALLAVQPVRPVSAVRLVGGPSPSP